MSDLVFCCAPCLYLDFVAGDHHCPLDSHFYTQTFIYMSTRRGVLRAIHSIGVRHGWRLTCGDKCSQASSGARKDVRLFLVGQRTKHAGEKDGQRGAHLFAVLGQMPT